MDIETAIPQPLAQALAARGYDALTPVQLAVLAPEADGRDALVSARTGSGKTVAFGLALAPTLLGGADRFGRAEAPLGLIVAPTRELALQVQRECAWLYARAEGIVAACVGGMDPRAERRALERGAHLVVGTPGRLRDHIERGALDMTGLRGVVLDEADEMLDLGFREDLEFILDAAPPERRTLMFSATVPRAIAALAARFQRDALRIAVEVEREQHADIAYRACLIAQTDRENAVFNLLRFHDPASAIVFCNTREGVAHMAARLTNRGLAVVALSGALSQSERTHALQAMRDGRMRVCVATDVAARGIDLPGLDLVVQADLPTNRDTLLHRSGRTGRAGRKGLCALMVPHRARRRAEGLLASASIAAEWGPAPSAAEIMARDDVRAFEDPALRAPDDEAEAEMARALLTRHGPEAVAAAFLRRVRGGLSAPEELIDVSGPEAVRPPREAFGPSVWFTLSVGRRQRAEPRWLLPMLCAAGGLTRRDIGAIRLDQTLTHVEIAEEAAERFLEAIGPERLLEGGVSVSLADGPPDAAPRPPAKPHRGQGKGGPGKPLRRPQR
ncbi:DEAD/DEAH box helicase [Rubrimonas sp.]|uniref:DEAD/DEAH box helicase n=1 Tax=Rubrimonas sp. TaxID=2036015 RepID=UPI002FDD7031